MILFSKNALNWSEVGLQRGGKYSVTFQKLSKTPGNFPKFLGSFRNFIEMFQLFETLIINAFILNLLFIKESVVSTKLSRLTVFNIDEKCFQPNQHIRPISEASHFDISQTEINYFTIAGINYVLKYKTVILYCNYISQ